jgi:hypothetical protein
MLTLPNVRVDVHVPDVPWVLGSEGKERGPAQFRETTEEDKHHASNVKHRLQGRDWRLLREQLVNVNFGQVDEVVAWLNSAGYVPELQGNRTLPARFTAEHVTPKIIASLRSQHDTVAHLMGLSDHDFRTAIEKAHVYDEDILASYKTSVEAALESRVKPQSLPRLATPLSSRGGRSERKCGLQSSKGHSLEEYEGKPYPARLKLAHPGQYFLGEVGAPAHLSAGQLEKLLRGTGVGSGLRASFHWDREGIAFVTVHVDTPMEAIILSVQIDRNFSKRQLVFCPCGKGFDQQRGRDRFCSPTHRNYYITKERRTKIKLAKQAAEAWKMLPATKRGGRDRWEWIAAWATRKGRVDDSTFDVKPEWAKKVVTKSKA